MCNGSENFGTGAKDHEFFSEPCVCKTQIVSLFIDWTRTLGFKTAKQSGQNRSQVLQTHVCIYNRQTIQEKTLRVQLSILWA